MVMFVAETEGPLDEVENFTKLLAGADVNVAIGLKRLGHSVTYATRLGRDPFGTYIEKKLRKEQIHIQITYDAVHFTGYQLKNKVSEGDPEVFYFRRNSAASHLSEADVEAIPLDGVRVLHMTGIPAALSGSCRNASYRLIERAHGLCQGGTEGRLCRYARWMHAHRGDSGGAGRRYRRRGRWFCRRHHQRVA